MLRALFDLWNNPRIFLPTLALVTLALAGWRIAANPFDRIPMPGGGFVDAERDGPIASLAWPIARAGAGEVNVKAVVPASFYPGTDRPRPEMLTMARQLFHIVKGAPGIRMDLTVHASESIHLAQGRADQTRALLGAAIAPPDVVTAAGALGPPKLEVAIRWKSEPRGGGREPIRLACGATEPIADADGRVWNPDPVPEGGLVWENRGQIANTAFPELFHRQRFTTEATLRYDLAVPAGDYTLTLWFAETYFGEAGRRLFHIDVNGKRLESSFDILAAAGGPYRAVSRNYAVSGAAGKVVVEMQSVRQAPSVNGIELVPR